MLRFKPIDFSDKAEAEPYLKATNTRMCEHCFTDLYIWSKHYGTEICIQDDFLFVKAGANTDEPHYLAPIGFGNMANGLSLIMEHARQNGNSFPMYGISAEIKAEMETAMPGKFTFTEMRDKADYIYYANDLITLGGKKLHAKRNFINRFTNDNKGRYEFCEIDDGNLAEVVEFHKKWCIQNGCHEDVSLHGEKCAVALGLKRRRELNLLTGVLYLDGKVVAYSFGSQMSDDTVVVQIEKADHTVDGAYPMINRLFAERHCRNVEFVNREEDMGLEGLRKAKLSYHPVFLLMKYRAVPAK